jgi:hypothetical protein
MASQDMEHTSEKQNLHPVDVRSQLLRLRFEGKKINQKVLAKRLRCSAVAITYAFQGKSAPLLARIKRHLDKISERKEAA